MLKSNSYKQKIGLRGYYLNGNLHKGKTWLPLKVEK